MNSIKQFPYSPVLGWSVSRYDLFSICKRKYYYQYYGSKYDPERSLINVIKKLRSLSSIPLEIGTVVHAVIGSLLNRLRRSNREIDRTRFFQFARQNTERVIANKMAFQEVYYAEREAVVLDDLYPKVRDCLDNLLTSDRYRWLIEKAIERSADWLIDSPENAENEKKYYGETRMDDLKAYFKVDCLFPLGDLLHLLDWKTGRQDADKYGKQLLGYAAWAVYHFNARPDCVRPAVAYLHPQYQEVEQTFDAVDLENFTIQIRAETDEMYEYCRDVQQNIPLDKAEFARVDNPHICSFCQFRGLCFPDRHPLPGQTIRGRQLTLENNGGS